MFDMMLYSVASQTSWVTYNYTVWHWLAAISLQFVLVSLPDSSMPLIVTLVVSRPTVFYHKYTFYVAMHYCILYFLHAKTSIRHTQSI